MLFLRREHSAGIKETLRISRGCGRQACRKDNESRWTAGRLHGPDMQQCSEDTEGCRALGMQMGPAWSCFDSDPAVRMDLGRWALEAWKVGEELSVASKLGAPESAQRADARGSLQGQAAAKVTHEAAKGHAHEGPMRCFPAQSAAELRETYCVPQCIF